MAKITSPAELKCDLPGMSAERNGLSLAHDCFSGKPMHNVHSVTIQVTDGWLTTRAYLVSQGYQELSGYRSKGVQYWTWTRVYPV